MQKRFDIITLFPEFFASPLESSLLAKAAKKGLLKIKVHDLRTFGLGPHQQVDDRPFGGGPGMVIRADVLATCLRKLTLEAEEGKKPYVILLDPSGTTLTQKKATSLLIKDWVILIAGHYEGVDERFKQIFVNEEISIGDYILSGGETAALVLLEVVARLIPGFVGKRESTEKESFNKVTVEGQEKTLLDYPVYTRPEDFEGKKVPGVLTSGNHEKIRQWRLEQAIAKTKLKRPDLLEN